MTHSTDAFGFKFVNNQLLADGFADAGLQTYIVDYLQGDGIGPEALQPGSGFDLVAWIKKHGDAEVRPPTDKTLAGLKERGITDIAAIGYCFGAHHWHAYLPSADDLLFAGGRYVFQLAQENAVKVRSPQALAQPVLTAATLAGRDCGAPEHGAVSERHRTAARPIERPIVALWLRNVSCAPPSESGGAY